MEELLHYAPLLNLIVLLGGALLSRQISNTNKIVTRIESLEARMNQLMTVCKFRHPDEPDPPELIQPEGD